MSTTPYVYPFSIRRLHLAKFFQALGINGGFYSAINEVRETWKYGPVAEITKGAVSPMGSTNAGALKSQALNTALLELTDGTSALRQLIPLARRVNFNVRIPIKNAGTTPSFVGEGAAGPLQNLQLSTATFDEAKVQVFLVLTNELIRQGEDAENEILASLQEDFSQQLDALFLSTTAGTAGTRPPGVWNGLSGAQIVSSTGYTASALANDFKNMIIGLQSFKRPVWIMSRRMLGVIGCANDGFLLQYASDGPRLAGYPVLITPQIGSVTLLDAQDLFIATDDDETQIDIAPHASAVMTDTPELSPAATSLESFWQRNLVGYRITYYVYWLLAHNTSACRMQVAY